MVDDRQRIANDRRADSAASVANYDVTLDGVFCVFIISSSATMTHAQVPATGNLPGNRQSTTHLLNIILKIQRVISIDVRIVILPSLS